jgi:hypothetical protein
MFMPANDVYTDAEWQRSHAIPTVGTWVDVDGAVGDPPAARGVVLG